MNALHFQKFDISKFKARCDECREFTTDETMVGKGCTSCNCPGIFQAIKVYQVALDAKDIASLKADGMYREYKMPESERAIMEGIEDGVINKDTLDAIGSVPDPSRQGKGQCNVCRRVCFDERQIGTRCNHLEKNGKKCVGTFNGTICRDSTNTSVSLDGDKVIQLCKALAAISKDFEALNIFEVKEMFLMGRKVASVEDMIRVSKMWDDAVVAIKTAFMEHVTEIDANKAKAKEMLSVVNQVIAQTQGVKQHHHAMSDLLALCDKLEAHRKSGLLDAISTIINHKPTQ